MILSELAETLEQALAEIDRSATENTHTLKNLHNVDTQIHSQCFHRCLVDTYGGDAATLKTKVTQLKSLCALFNLHFGDGPVRLLRAPARINILGEHIDYVSYIPTASLTFGSREHDMFLLFRPSEKAQVKGISSLHDCSPFLFQIDDDPELLSRGSDPHGWSSYLFSKPIPAPNWGNYVRGSVFFAKLKYPELIRKGFEFAVHSSIPPGGGASSSSALTVLTGAAIRYANQIPIELQELAKDSAQAEWFPGTRGGDMDHRTICLARRQQAVFLSYQDSRSETFRMPGENFSWVTFYSHPANKGRELMLEYNERSAVSRLFIPAILQSWSQSDPSFDGDWKQTLQELKEGNESARARVETILSNLPGSMSIDELRLFHRKAFSDCEQAFPALVTDRADNPLKIRDRALHHLREARRVNTARHLLLQGVPENFSGNEAKTEDTMRKMGQLLNESHDSLCQLYEVCTAETTQLVRIVRRFPETYGSRLMGGGFGGNVLVLTTRQQAENLIQHVQLHYYAPRGRDAVGEGAVMISTPGEGLSELLASRTAG